MDAKQTSDLSNSMCVMKSSWQSVDMPTKALPCLACGGTGTLAEEQENELSMCRRMTRRKSNLADLMDAQSQPTALLMRQTM